MHKTIVIAFSTLDGITEDPDGSGGTPGGGWAFRHGPDSVAGDKFRLGQVLDSAVLLLGRRTWELFSHIWPTRTDEFSTAMNRIPKLVASRTLDDASAWDNSRVIDEDLRVTVTEQVREREVIVAGSASVVHSLAEADLVDEYRILLFPTALGTGTRLFSTGSAPARLRLVSAEPVGQTVLLRYVRMVG